MDVREAAYRLGRVLTRRATTWRKEQDHLGRFGIFPDARFDC
jgi:hypothetical protein